MRIVVIVGAVMVVGLVGSARAEPGPWQLGASGVSRIDSSGHGGAGVALDAVHDLGSASAIGAAIEHTWLDRGSDSPEFGARQLDMVALVRFERPLSLELGLGVAVYHARVDIPAMPGCFGCGRYAGTTVSPLGRVGVVWSYPLADHITLELGARLVITGKIMTSTDVHNFDPQPTTLQASVGLNTRL